MILDLESAELFPCSGYLWDIERAGRPLWLDLYDLNTAEDMHDRFAEELKFPHHYGRNKDAFWDCLWGLEAGTVVIVSRLDRLEPGLRTLVEEYLAILEEFSHDTEDQIEVVLR